MSGMSVMQEARQGFLVETMVAAPKISAINEMVRYVRVVFWKTIFVVAKSFEDKQVLEDALR